MNRPRPNVVVILADDLGYGDLGCNNPDSRIPTPHLDRLAAEGVRATDAHAPASVCSPTRYGLLTGRYAWRGALKRGVVVPWGPPILEENRLNLAWLLRGYGYATGCFGKWHLGWTWPTRDGRPPKGVQEGPTNVDFTRRIADGPTDRGFDTYFGVDLPNYPPYCFVENDRTVGVPTRHVEREGQINRPGPVLDGWRQEAILPEVTRRACAWIEERAKTGQPFFAYVPLPSPHYPIVPTPEWRGKTPVGAYGDFVAQTDHEVGRILETLRRAGVERDTLVLFTSDNGPEVGEVEEGAYDRLVPRRHDSRGGWRGVKRDIWEGGHRVPFLARWPGHLAPGGVCAGTLCLTDLLATVAGILGAPLPDDAGEDSVDILPALRGAPSPRERIGTVHHMGSGGGFGLRLGDRVLIDAPTGNDNRGRIEPGAPSPHGLDTEWYDLRADPAQRDNRAGREPVVAWDLRERLHAIRRDRRSVPHRRPRPDLGVGARPERGARVLIDGTRETLDRLWTYWQGPRFRSALPIRWPLVPDPVDGGWCLQTDDPAAAGGLYGAADLVTKEAFRDFRLHIEFWIGGPGGNSGVYLQNRYEIQICDGDRTSHGLGAVINETPAPYFAYRGLRAWNAYDLVFRAARFSGGRRVEPARVTLYLNGIRAHTDVAIRQVWGGPASGVDGGNDDGRGITDTPEGLKLQCEGHDVRYRNAWIKPLDLGRRGTEF